MNKDAFQVDSVELERKIATMSAQLDVLRRVKQFRDGTERMQPIIETLREGPLTVVQIANRLKQTTVAVSTNLQKLRRLGLVVSSYAPPCCTCGNKDMRLRWSLPQVP